MFLIFSTLSAQKSHYAASFLELGVGARALAMGSAHIGLATDATGFYWNPGGLAMVPNIQGASMYANLFDKLEQQNYISAAMPVFGGATISLAWIRLSIDDIPRYTFDENQLTNAYQRITGSAEPLTGEPVDFFSSYEDAYFISFARRIPWKIDLGWQYFELPVDVGIGMNLKMLRQKLDNQVGSGVGLDAGVLFRVALNDVFVESYYGELSFGMQVQDLTKTQITWDTDSKHKDQIPRNFKYGLAYTQPLRFMRSQLSLAYDVDTRYEGSTFMGGELLYNSLLAVRIGLNRSHFTTGAGIYLWKFRFDYAYQSHDLGNSHRISVLFGY